MMYWKTSQLATPQSIAPWGAEAPQSGTTSVEQQRNSECFENVFQVRTKNICTGPLSFSGPSRALQLFRGIALKSLLVVLDVTDIAHSLNIFEIAMIVTNGSVKFYDNRRFVLLMQVRITYANPLGLINFMTTAGFGLLCAEPPTDAICGWSHARGSKHHRMAAWKLWSPTQHRKICYSTEQNVYVKSEIEFEVEKNTTSNFAADWNCEVS